MMICLFAAMALAAGLGARRSAILQAETKRIDIVFSGQTNRWDLGEATRCDPLPHLDLHAERGKSVCDPRRFNETTEPIALSWQNGAKAQVQVDFSGRLVVIPHGQPGLADGTRIVVPSDSWRRAGALAFTGHATVGTVIASGETGYLISGSYDIRERSIWAGTTETVKSGQFLKGENVSVDLDRRWRMRAPALVYGHITAPSSEGPALDVGLLSQVGRVVITVGYFGGRDPAVIAPNWVDRTLSRPLILALATVLSVLFGAHQLLPDASRGLNVGFRRTLAWMRPKR
jgi:hypothetical protein